MRDSTFAIGAILLIVLDIGATPCKGVVSAAWVLELWRGIWGS